MNSEENTIKLITMLDKAVEEIEKIDQRLQIYEDKICVISFDDHFVHNLIFSCVLIIKGCR